MTRRDATLDVLAQFNEQIVWADASTFDVFRFPLVSGDVDSLIAAIHQSNCSCANAGAPRILAMTSAAHTFARLLLFVSFVVAAKFEWRYFVLDVHTGSATALADRGLTKVGPKALKIGEEFSREVHPGTERESIGIPQDYYAGGRPGHDYVRRYPRLLNRALDLLI